jgi:hypothetical protein
MFGLWDIDWFLLDRMGKGDILGRALFNEYTCELALRKHAFI